MARFNQDIFNPGMTLKLMAATSVKVKVGTILVGYRTGQYLVVEKPSNKGAPVKLAEGVEWNASFVQSGDIISFATRILGHSFSPFPLVFLAYPEKVSTTALRQNKRYPVDIRGSIALNRDEAGTIDPNANVLVRDISEGGCLVGSFMNLEPGTNIELSLDISNHHRIEGLKAEVKTCRGNQGRYLLGLSFNPGFLDKSYSDLKSFIDTLRSIPIRV